MFDEQISCSSDDELFGAQAASGALFGAPAGGSGLFAGVSPPAVLGGGGLFGAPAGGGGLFAGVSPPAVLGGGGLFGASAGGGGLFGASGSEDQTSLTPAQQWTRSLTNESMTPEAMAAALATMSAEDRAIILASMTPDGKEAILALGGGGLFGASGSEDQTQQPLNSSRWTAAEFYAASMPQRDQYFRENDPQFSQLCDKLQAVAEGRIVTRWEGENELLLLLSLGGLMDGPIEVVPGQQSNCHQNVADLLDWHDQQGIVGTRVATGWCYSEGLWRQHSWAVAADGTILETCGPPCPEREKYWGAILGGHDRVKFRMKEASSNAYEFTPECARFAEQIASLSHEAATEFMERIDRRSQFIKERDGFGFV